MGRYSRCRSVRLGALATLVATLAALAGVLAAVFAVAVTVPGGASAAGTSSTSTTYPSPLPPITPHNRPGFRPVLGDWDGTANGFPASFTLTYDKRLRRPGGQSGNYGISNLVALRPSACPASSARYVEDLLQGTRPADIGSFGSLGLSRFGFGGNFLGARTATLSHAYRPVGGCHGMLTWKLHPAARAPVGDGAWRASFRDGTSEMFHVRSGGRLVTGLALPGALVRCAGVTGAIDLFVHPNGSVRLSSSQLRVAGRFTGKRATGTLNAGGHSCLHGPVRFTAALVTHG